MARPKAPVIEVLLIATILANIRTSHQMSKEEKRQLRDEAREMFYHGYRSYMEHAYPADELMPLSCRGRSRGTKPSRGDMDDILGNFSLTLVDSFDTLVILGDVEEFESATRRVINHVTFDRDVVVSVFETNIRMLGGLLSGHVLASYLRDSNQGLHWYRAELLEMAKELGYRILPAFNTTTGIPYPKVNLRHGVRRDTARTGHEKDTCTACAGTMLLEFAALSRLSGEPIFEAKAHRAMDSLWQYRHRSSNLVGTVINIHNGEWVRRDSGIGAGIDSYYEYLLKAYILLGDDTYLDRFNKHYDSIMRYINQGPLMVDVHMHKPHAAARNFMDALFAFWPGLQVLKGDIKPAIEIHEMLYQVLQRHNFLPEAFTTDFRVHWAQHPLRPEFIESTYFIYRATKDPHYLEVGKKVMENLKRHAMVSCGFAAIKDVTTGKQEDQMDSFVLSETFKYLYLLFSEEEDLILNVDDFVFTTEAHLLPLSLSLHDSDRNISTAGMSAVFYQREVADDDHEVTCPNLLHNDLNYGQRLRHPLRNLVESVCPKTTSKKSANKKPRLRASEFTAGNMQQISQLRDMGIKIVTMSDGRVQLLHTASDAASQEEAQNGMVFMQEMIELSKSQSAEQVSEPHVVQLLSEPFYGNVVLQAGPAQFGFDLNANPGIRGRLALADPKEGCGSLRNAELLAGNVVIVKRGECMFVDKARVLEDVGAKGVIVIDNVETTSAQTSPLFAMSGDSTDDVDIPVVFLFAKEGKKLLDAFEAHPDLEVYLSHTDKTLDEVLREMLEKERLVSSSWYRKIGVAIRSFDGERREENEDEAVMHTFFSDGGQPIFRIAKREADRVLEIQLEKRALEGATKRQLSSLVEEVAGLVRAEKSFGDLDLIQQSDRLFALGKLMEASVRGDSEDTLASCLADVMQGTSRLTVGDILDAVSAEKRGDVFSEGGQLHDFVDMLVDDYIQKQFKTVYDEAEQFLKGLGLSLPEHEEGEADCDGRPPEAGNEARMYMEKRKGDFKSPRQSRDVESSGEFVRCVESDDGESVTCESESGTWILPKSESESVTVARRKSGKFQDSEGDTYTENVQRHFVSEEDIIEEKTTNNKVMVQKVQDAKIKESTRVYKPPDWMSLEDDEIFFDADGIIYANYAEEYYYGESTEAETDDLDPNHIEWINKNRKLQLQKSAESTIQELKDLQKLIDELSENSLSENSDSNVRSSAAIRESQISQHFNSEFKLENLESADKVSDETEILSESVVTSSEKNHKNPEREANIMEVHALDSKNRNEEGRTSGGEGNEQYVHLRSKALPDTDLTASRDRGRDAQNGRHNVDGTQANAEENGSGIENSKRDEL